MKQTNRSIFVTETDLSRLEAIADDNSSPAMQLLREDLAGAKIVKSDEIPPDVVTMNSRITFLDLQSGDEMEVTLVYPNASNVDQGKISVTAPIGAAIFGLSVGDEIEWPVPSGTKQLKVTAVLYQPEAAGRYDL